MTIAPQSFARRPFRVPLSHTLWTARILFGGPAWRDVMRSLSWGLYLLFYGLMKLRGNQHDAVTLSVFAVLFALFPASLTMVLEQQWARRLAFIELLPQRVGALRLGLWPLRFLGIVLGVTFTLVGHFPLLAGPIITGCIWWSISVGHFCAGHGPWTRLLMIPLSLFHSIFVGLAVSGDKSLGLGVAVAVTPALLALLVPFGGKIGRLLSGTMPVPRRSRAAITTRPVPPVAFLALVKPRRTSGSLYRAAKLAMASVRGGLWIASVVLLIQFLLVAGGMMRSSVAWIHWVLGSMAVSGMLAQAMDRSRLEFLRMRPLPQGRLFGALILPCVALVLGFSALQCFFIKIAASTPFRPFDRGVWWFLTQGLGVSQQSLVRSAAGARFAMSADLVSRLYGEALRSAFLGLAVLFVFPLLSISTRATPGFRWTTRGLSLIVLGAVISYYPLMFQSFWWPLPPLWLAAALAVTCGYVFFRQLFADSGG